jgi:hypothetical protein
MTLLNLASLFHYSINISSITPYGSDAFPNLVPVQKFCRGRKRAFPIAATQKQPFPLSHYCRIDDHPSFASAAQTNDLSRGAILQHDSALQDSACLTQQLLHVLTGNSWNIHLIV